MNSEERFAEVALFSLIEDAATMRTKLNRIKDAANYANVAKKTESVAGAAKASASRKRGR